MPLVSNRYHNYHNLVKYLNASVETIPANEPIIKDGKGKEYISHKLDIIIAPERDAFNTWSSHNLPLFNIIDNQKVVIVLDINAQNVFIIARKDKFQ